MRWIATRAIWRARGGSRAGLLHLNAWHLAVCSLGSRMGCQQILEQNRDDVCFWFQIVFFVRALVLLNKVTQNIYELHIENENLQSLLPIQ